MDLRSQRERTNNKPRTAFRCAFLFSRCLLCAFAFLVLLSPSSMPLGVVTIFDDDAGPAMSRRKEGGKGGEWVVGGETSYSVSEQFLPGSYGSGTGKGVGVRQARGQEGREGGARTKDHRSDQRRGDYYWETTRGPPSRCWNSADNDRAG